MYQAEPAEPVRDAALEASGRLHPLDARLLELVQRAFSSHAGSDGRIDLGELQTSLEIQSKALARRVLAVFDDDGDGFVRREEFLEGVRRLAFGSVHERAHLAFRLHDLDGDGVIERPELREMIALAMAEEDAGFNPRDADRLADSLLKAADRHGDGHLSYEEFETALSRHPPVFAMIGRCVAQWIAPNEGLLTGLEDRRSRLERWRRYGDNHLALLLLLTAWAAANIALFAHAFAAYQPRGVWVQVARGCGACINLNGALIFIPVMRRVLTYVRRTPGLNALPLDDAPSIHRFLGHALLALALVHTAAHLTHYSVTQNALLGSLFGTRAGASGLALLAVFLVMWVLARPAVRSSDRFELFYFSHLAYLAWAVLALLHGPVFWIWAGVPLVVLGLEQLWRAFQRSQATEILSAQALRSSVTRLSIRRAAGFEHRAGDYVFLRIPHVAPHEWHPFTISSAPDSEFLTFHVRSLGNFTKALWRLAERRSAEGDVSPLPVYVDGPYGGASGQVFASRHTVLIGAGIGVTPFASVLESLLLRCERGEVPLRKAHFFWLNRDPFSFEWFADLLRRLEASDRARRIDIHICMTGRRSNGISIALNLAREVSYSLGNPDQVTGLRTKTRIGQPDWRRELSAIRTLHAPDDVDVFFCGPPGLARHLRKVCGELDMRFRQEPG
jgi:predicted ferric reductase/Ca2+-binding EF-hand superfamily protein